MDPRGENTAGNPAIKGMPDLIQSQMPAIIVAVVVVILSIVIFALFLRKRVKQRGILLLGLSDSGKTLVFARLVYKKFVETHTSITENVADYTDGNVTFQIIDVPGQERVRNRILDQFKSSARGLVYVIDSSNVQEDLRDVAEYLYSILSDSTIQSISPPLIVLCNKQDIEMAKGATAIRKLLEKELNIVRRTKTSQLDTIDNKSKGVFLGVSGKDFEFDDLSQKITFAESSAIMAEEEEGPDIVALEEWVQKL